MKTKGKTPSTGAVSTSYSEVQSDEAQAIYDGRIAAVDVSTVAPPIQIYHPIFDEFLYLVNDPDVQPTVDDLKNVQELMQYASKVGRSETHYSEGLRTRLRKILHADVHEEPNPDRSIPDGVVTLNIGDSRITSVVIELKREMGEGGCDPTLQASLSMRRSWIDPLVSRILIHPNSAFNVSVEECCT